MCQIHIINRETYNKNETEVITHLDNGDYQNDHGCSALFIQENGAHTLIQSLNWDIIRNVTATNDEWETVFIHQRFTTQGEANLMNTHMWRVGDFYYCHNGVLSHQDIAKYEVDSQLIGQHLERGNVWEAIAYCQSESYANTFIINLHTKEYWVTRSQVNTLYTDGNGQYSTEILSSILDKPVPEFTVRQHKIDCDEYQKWDYSNYNWNQYEKTQASMGNYPLIQKPLDKLKTSVVKQSKSVTTTQDGELGETELERRVHQAAIDGNIEEENYYTTLLFNKRKSIN